jgi:flagellar hook-basal body complex protein FliE
MKKSSLILAIIFLFSMVFYQGIIAQEKSKEEKEKELQETIEAQKKEMVEQKKAQEEYQKQAQKALDDSKIQIDKALQDVKVLSDDPQVRDRVMRAYRDLGGNRMTGEPFVFTPGVEFYGQHFGGDSERTTWEFSKYVKESTFSRDYTFDVEPTVNTVVMAVNGDCKSGEIRIKIVMPGGKTYSDIVIDEFGNLNWRKSFTISDTENKDKAGAWKFEINSSKASGYFRISLQTY